MFLIADQAPPVDTHFYGSNADGTIYEDTASSQAFCPIRTVAARHAHSLNLGIG